MSSSNATTALDDAIECGIARGWTPDRIIQETGCPPQQIRRVWARMEALVADDKDVSELRRHERAVRAHTAQLAQALEAHRATLPKPDRTWSTTRLMHYWNDLYPEPVMVKRGRLVEATREADGWTGRSNIPTQRRALEVESRTA